MENHHFHFNNEQYDGVLEQLKKKTSLQTVALQITFGGLVLGLFYIIAAYAVCMLAGVHFFSTVSTVTVFGSLLVIMLINMGVPFRTYKYIAALSKHDLKWCWAKALCYGLYGELALRRPNRSYCSRSYSEDERDEYDIYWDYLLPFSDLYNWK